MLFATQQLAMLSQAYHAPNKSSVQIKMLTSVAPLKHPHKANLTHHPHAPTELLPAPQTSQPLPPSTSSKKQQQHHHSTSDLAQANPAAASTQHPIPSAFFHPTSSLLAHNSPPTSRAPESGAALSAQPLRTSQCASANLGLLRPGASRIRGRGL
jgi:hypothetical protein